MFLDLYAIAVVLATTAAPNTCPIEAGNSPLTQEHVVHQNMLATGLVGKNKAETVGQTLVGPGEHFKCAQMADGTYTVFVVKSDA